VDPLEGRGKSRPTRIRFPEGPTRSELLYRANSARKPRDAGFTSCTTLDSLLMLYVTLGRPGVHPRRGE
jgi:hypothetical protein